MIKLLYRYCKEDFNGTGIPLGSEVGCNIPGSFQKRRKHGVVNLDDWKPSECMLSHACKADDVPCPEATADLGSSKCACPHEENGEVEPDVRQVPLKSLTRNLMRYCLLFVQCVPREVIILQF